MLGAEVIFKYFPNLSDKQKSQFEALYDIYVEWNSKINVISRKDIDNLYVHHVLHSLSIAKFNKLQEFSDVLDIGTGGGFPGIPLAIMYPHITFRLVDSIKKKLTVIDEVKWALRLENVHTEHNRAEKVAGHFDFVITRAVANLTTLNEWTTGKFKQKHNHYPILNGLIALKGGDLKEELAPFKDKKVQQIAISDYFEEEFFKEKYLVYLPYTNKEKEKEKEPEQAKGKDASKGKVKSKAPEKGIYKAKPSDKGKNTSHPKMGRKKPLR